MLDMWVESGRAAIAATLSLLQPGDNQLRCATHFSGMGVDARIFDGEEGVRVHHKARHEFFTPLRVAGAPPAKELTPARITEGRYLDAGVKFRRVQTWSARASAHADLGRRWTGRTRFLLRAGVASNTEGEPAKSSDNGQATSAAMSRERKKLLKNKFSDELPSSRDS